MNELGHQFGKTVQLIVREPWFDEEVLAEHLVEAVQRRLDEHPEKVRQRRERVEHPFGTIKARMGATHFLMKTLPRVATEMALHVLAYIARAS